EDRAPEGGARYRRLVAVGGDPRLGLPDDADGRADLPARLLASATVSPDPDPSLGRGSTGRGGEAGTHRAACRPGGTDRRLRLLPGPSGPPVAGRRRRPCRSVRLYPLGLP